MSLHRPAPRPAARGPLSAWLLDLLAHEPPAAGPPPPVETDDPLADEDLHLALTCAYELHYRGFEEVDDRWKWNT